MVKYRFNSKDSDRVWIHKDLNRAIEAFRESLISSAPKKKKAKITKTYASRELARRFLE